MLKECQDYLFIVMTSQINVPLTNKHIFINFKKMYSAKSLKIFISYNFIIRKQIELFNFVGVNFCIY